VLATLLIGRAVQHYGYVPVFTGMSALHLTAFVFIIWMLRRGGADGTGRA
jgi:ACS family hexuronate transporter-like MFS transporter